MFSKSRRIPRKMFPLLSERAKTAKNNLFSLRFVPTSQQARFCFSVSKKIAKSAVLRNRMRRAGYRLLEKYLPKIQSTSLVLFSYRAVPRNDSEVDKNIESLLIEAKLIPLEAKI